MKKRYYITLSNRKIQVPYKIQNSKMTNYTIIDQMFPDISIPEPYWGVVDKIMLAIKENKPQQWEDAGFGLQSVIKETGDTKLNSWASHFFDVCYRLENPNSRKRKTKMEIDVPSKELDFIIPSDTEIKLTKRYKLEKGIV